MDKVMNNQYLKDQLSNQITQQTLDRVNNSLYANKKRWRNKSFSLKSQALVQSIVNKNRDLNIGNDALNIQKIQF